MNIDHEVNLFSQIREVVINDGRSGETASVINLVAGVIYTSFKVSRINDIYSSVTRPEIIERLNYYFKVKSKLKSENIPVSNELDRSRVAESLYFGMCIEKAILRAEEKREMEEW